MTYIDQRHQSPSTPRRESCAVRLNPKLKTHIRKVRIGVKYILKNKTY